MSGKKVVFSVVLVVFLVSGRVALADCPSADFDGDGFVDFEDLAVIGADWLNGHDWNDVQALTNQWLSTGFCVPDDMVYVAAGEFEMGDSFGEGQPDELPLHRVILDSFYIGKYQVTNSQYCAYLNSALGTGIYVSGGVVYGSENNQPYCDTHGYDTDSQIDYSDGVFSVRTKNGRDTEQLHTATG